MSLRGLDIITGAMSPEEQAEEWKFHIVSSIVGAVIGAFVSVMLLRDESRVMGRRIR